MISQNENDMEYVNQFAGIIARNGNYIDLDMFKNARSHLVERIKAQNLLRREVGLDEMDENQSKIYIANNVRIDSVGFPPDFANNTQIIIGMADDYRKHKTAGAL